MNNNPGFFSKDCKGGIQLERNSDPLGGHSLFTDFLQPPEMLFTEPRRSAGRRIRGRRLEELHLPWRRDTAQKCLIFRQICCAGITVAAFLTLEQLEKQRVWFFKSGTCSMSSCAVASHLLSPPQSHHLIFIPSTVNLQSEHSLLFLENKVICCLLCKEAKHKKTKKFANCSVLSNGLLFCHLQGK